VSEDKSMREEFEDALAEVEDTPEVEEAEAPVEETPTDETEQTPEEETTAETPSTEVQGEESTPPTDTGHEGGDDKAPASWTPAAREEWANTPTAIREQINKRETEISKALQEGAESRKTGERFSDVVTRFSSVIAAEGVQDPIVGFEELMKTMTTMRMGSPQQKANQLAGFVKNYGVDIGMLDSALAGAAPPAVDPMEARLNERMAPVNDLLNRINQAEQNTLHQQNQNINNEVEAFGAKAEFFTDVRLDMADIIEVAEKQGRPLTLDQAYERACALNPEIAKVMQGRAKTQQILGSNADISAKESAASSIAGKQGGTGGSAGGLTLHDELSQLWDAQG